MLWDLFCRVIDNYGDVGVCWRLARHLGAAGEQVRLWIDDERALRWMAPGGAPGVECRPFADDPACLPGDVVIEAFGCDPPPTFVARMAARQPRPVWINLEYLSAESYVERSHGLRSPQFAGPGAGLDKWFFYPGFSEATGGLLPAAEVGDRRGWLQSHGWAPREGERVVLLFCYDNPALPRLLHDLARAPTLLLAAAGAAQAALTQAHGSPLRGVALPHLPQPVFDELIACVDLSIVRGEDSFAQACQSGRPFVWQPYPQADGAHGPKLNAFLDRFVGTARPAEPDALRTLWHGWNGLGAWTGRWPALNEWQAATQRWRDALRGQEDLMTRLRRFVDARR
ncbi:MAG TPA: elongation factor P maturation arginine rhamnosyltransferase EarP [Aquabacterium sp.]|nr:elongation factor P maturation arginine rhamnosyltransferase EarP [Aquabacterium sp.]